MSTARLVVLALLVQLTACLEGDPNAIGQQGAFTGSSGTSGSSANIPTVEPSSCSGVSTKQVTLTFRNRTSDRSLALFWVNQQCGEVSYGTIEPGGSQVQPTFIGHVWRVRDGATNALYKEHLASEGVSSEVGVP